MATNSPTSYTSTALETFSLVTGPNNLNPTGTGYQTNPGHCALLGFVVENASGAAGWVQVFDGYAQPTTGASPLMSLVVSNLAGQNQVSFGGNPNVNIRGKTGIVVALSSTRATYTPVTNGQFITAFYTF